MVQVLKLRPDDSPMDPDLLRKLHINHQDTWLVVWNSPGSKPFQFCRGSISPIFGRLVYFAMATEWDKVVNMHGLFHPNWSVTEKGTSVSLVVDCLVHTHEMVLGLTVPDGRKMRLFGDISGQIRGCRRLTLFDVTVDFAPDTVDLLITDVSNVVAHGLRPAADAFRVIELCAGVACSGAGLSEVGFSHLASVEWKPPLASLHQTCHPEVQVHVCDITSPDCVKQLLQQHEPPFSLMSGFSCQPYSTGGAQAGSSDERSSTLPASLRACYLCQSPLLILECVAPARCNKFVQAHLGYLESQLGYHVSQTCLKLEDIWVARRYRWWVVATHPSLGKVELPDWPRSPNLVVRDLLPVMKQWEPEVAKALELQPHEITRFTMDGSHLRKYLMQKDGKLPTCLHSWGSQADPCPCGCRLAGFSETLIQQRGIYAQLVQFHTEDGLVAFRHLHPIELSLMNGFLPPAIWNSPDHPDLRLCLCAVGQLASPLQAIWVGGCALKHMQQVLGLPQVRPAEVLADYRKKLFQAAHELLHDTPPPTIALNMVEIRHPDGTVVHVQVTDTTTLAQLCQAEIDLTQHALEGQWCDANTGGVLAADALVTGLCIRVQPFAQLTAAHPSVDFDSLDPAILSEIPLDFDSVDFPRVASEASEAGVSGVPSIGVSDCPRRCPDGESDLSAPAFVMPAEGLSPDALSGLKHLSSSQLVALVPPLVSDVQVCMHMRQAAVPSSSRLAVLHNQGGAMGDDEINLHVHACLAIAKDPHTQYLDPLLATTWLQHGTVTLVRDWLACLPSVRRIVTVVLVHEHWIPIVWTRGLTEVHVSIWECEGSDVDCLCPLHGLVSQAWGLPRFAVACTRRSFSGSYCGAAAVAYIAHVLIDSCLPHTESLLLDLHEAFRVSFREAVGNLNEVPKPWCWGLGQVDVVGLTASLLQLHGVPMSQATTRAKLVIQSLGRNEVQNAVTGVSPWKSLKALANLQTPVLQLVLPDEAAQKVIAKQSTTNAKSNATKKLLPSKPVDIDPAKLLLDVGAFCTGNDEPLSQIPFGAIGPLAKGVTIASFSDALPFLQAGKLLTHQSLAMLVLNPPNELPTCLQWSSLRFAVRCSVNQEPMLLAGVLVQLGQQVVYQFRSKDLLTVPTVDVACARVTVYYDQLDMCWEDFATKPVKHILALLPCLQTCRTDNCSCPSWHPKPDQPNDALLDVFRRQFFNDAGRPVKWDRASHFAVMIRYVKSMEQTVLAMSGTKGVFIEPKTEDALKPSPEFQVIWLPQLDFASVTHKARCEVHCIGIARSGQRFGLRVPLAHFPEVFASVKPDAVYLAPGSRSTYHCGPWPYGSDRKMLARVLKASGWDCRPLQPLHGVPGGLMWAVQAVVAPATNVLSLSHGQVVITAQDTKPTAADHDATVVGPAQTVKMCLTDHAADPWLSDDPWRKATASIAGPPAAPPASSALQEMEERLEQSILAKLPTTTCMEVDSQDQRLQQLEQQFQHLAQRQTTLEATVTDHHVQSTAQVQSLQQQMLVQMDMQSKQMQTMLTDQMSRIETILAKKPRTE